MGARTFIEMTPGDFRKIADELQKLAEKAIACADRMESENETSFGTFGVKHGVEGMDALANVFSQIISPYESRKPDLVAIRKKLDAAKKKTVEEAHAKITEIDKLPKARQSTPPQDSPEDPRTIPLRRKKKTQKPQA